MMNLSEYIRLDGLNIWKKYSLPWVGKFNISQKAESSINVAFHLKSELIDLVALRNNIIHLESQTNDQVLINNLRRKLVDYQQGLNNLTSLIVALSKVE